METEAAALIRPHRWNVSTFMHPCHHVLMEEKLHVLPSNGSKHSDKGDQNKRRHRHSRQHMIRVSVEERGGGVFLFNPTNLCFADSAQRSVFSDGSDLYSATVDFHGSGRNVGRDAETDRIPVKQLNPLWNESHALLSNMLPLIFHTRLFFCVCRFSG